MTDEDVWAETVKGVKRIQTNCHVEKIEPPKEIEFRQNKEVTVTFGFARDDGKRCFRAGM